MGSRERTCADIAVLLDADVKVLYKNTVRVVTFNAVWATVRDQLLETSR